MRVPDGRVLGIDFGERRVGVAVSDPTGTLASPLETVHRRRGKRPPVRKLAEIAEREGVEALVVGLPIELDGTETPWCDEVRAFGGKLSERTGLPVAFVDERFSSVRAEEAVRSAGLPKKKREDRDRVDAAAAAIILQAFLDGAPGR